jgi:CHAD domain-containing protein
VALRIKPHETVPRAIARMAREELAEARDKVADQREPVTARVHDVRTAIKKLRALSRMVEPAVGRPARRAGRRLQKVARGVSGARDAEVVLEIFDQVVDGADERRSGSLARARAALAARLREHARPLRHGRKTNRLRKRLARERRKVKRWVPTEDRWRAIGGGIDDGYRRARAAMSTAYSHDTGVDFHKWRRAVKTHRHQVYAVEPIEPRRLSARIDKLDRLGDLLGDEHDLTVLEQTIRDEQSCFPDERSCDHLLRLVSARRFRLRARARPLGRELFAERPSQFRAHLRRDFRAFRGRGS